ncbi:MAG: AraC family transcriptional regulator [Bacteroidetes bacterium]|nr:MAG: AraC family transcriptional regulator [Bacteroidota bacterium]
MQNYTSMKELLEEMRKSKDESYYIGIFQDHIGISAWHYHQEYELSFITEGTGKRIVGDSIEEFSPGDLIFIGPKIPHVWFSHGTQPRQHSGRTLESVYLLFNNEVLPEALVQLPEFSSIRMAIRHSERGIRITGETLNEVSRLMLQLPYLERLKRLMYFYEIMDLIGHSNSFSFLASESYVRSRFEATNTRIGKIHEYLMKNYHEEVNLEEIAGIVHMAPASACRFFKSSTGMTIFEYLNKIKIDYSCKLLLNSDRNVVNISYDCGFNNLSHFNKQFKKFIGKTPSQFRKVRQIHNTY